jgi:hypothetical protein
MGWIVGPSLNDVLAALRVRRGVIDFFKEGGCSVSMGVNSCDLDLLVPGAGVCAKDIDLRWTRFGV